MTDGLEALQQAEAKARAAVGRWPSDEPPEWWAQYAHLLDAYAEAVRATERVRAAALAEDIGRILEEARRRVAPLVAREREAENIGSIMDFRMKGWSREGTFSWLVERSNALGEVDAALAAYQGGGKR